MQMVRGAWIDVAPTVYPPSEDSLLLVDSLGDVRGRRLLDIGTGSGIVAIVASLAGAAVTAVDRNPAAVSCARRNADTNKVRIDFREGDLFSAVAERFDVVTFNPPYLPTDPEERPGPEVRSWDGGPGGAAIIDRFLRGLPDHLAAAGRALLVLSTMTDYDLDAHLPSGWSHVLRAERPFFFERISVHELAGAAHSRGEAAG